MKYRVKVKPNQILLVLDQLSKGMTESKWKKDPKRAEAIYDAYQTFGQALGEKNIILEFEESAPKSNVGDK